MVDRELTITPITRRLRNRVARAVLGCAGSLSKNRLVSVDFVRAVRPLATGDEPLLPPARPVLGQHLADPVLARHLMGRTLGTWTLGPQSLAFVTGLVSQNRPGLAIEFGSGVSTLALAAAMRDSGIQSTGPVVVSLEQDEAHAEETRDLLHQAGLADLAAIVVAPLERQWIEGVHTNCYLIPHSFEVAMGGRKADLVLVDGPAAESGARFGTLPLVRSFLSNRAQFVLDDALRDGELEVASRWAALSYLKIHGIRLVEKGLLIGTIEG